MCVDTCEQKYISRSTLDDINWGTSQKCQQMCQRDPWKHLPHSQDPANSNLMTDERRCSVYKCKHLLAPSVACLCYSLFNKISWNGILVNMTGIHGALRVIQWIGIWPGNSRKGREWDENPKRMNCTSYFFNYDSHSLLSINTTKQRFSINRIIFNISRIHTKYEQHTYNNYVGLHLHTIMW